MVRQLALLATVLACTGCGIKGPLVLPPAPPAAAAPPAATPSDTPPVEKKQ